MILKRGNGNAGKYSLNTAAGGVFQNRLKAVSGRLFQPLAYLQHAVKEQGYSADKVENNRLYVHKNKLTGKK